MEREEWDRRYETSELVWTAKPNKFLVAEVEGMEPGCAMDVGAGEGRNAVWLAEHGWRVTAVDFSAVGLEKARQMARGRGVEVEWVVADLREYEPEPHFYDLVIVLYLHVEAEHRRRLHMRLAQALAPAGTLLIIGHDTSNIAHGYGGPQDPAILFSSQDVVDDVSAVPGISIARAEQAIRSVETDAGERTAIDALVRAVRCS